jgi:prophage antirepressor-like protein
MKIPYRGITIIPESDVFRLLIKSKLPAAERFERWVMEEVLPAIRKTGSYSVFQTTQDTQPVDSTTSNDKHWRVQYLWYLLHHDGRYISERVKGSIRKAIYDMTMPAEHNLGNV